MDILDRINTFKTLNEGVLDFFKKKEAPAKKHPDYMIVQFEASDIDDEEFYVLYTVDPTKPRNEGAKVSPALSGDKIYPWLKKNGFVPDEAFTKGSLTPIYFKKADGISEGTLRKVQEFGTGPNRAVVMRDAEWEEFRVVFWKDGKKQEKADYHTDDKKDALDTAKAYVEKNKVDESATKLETMTKEEAKKITGNQPAWAMKNMIKALSMMPRLNSPEENHRLEVAKMMVRKGWVK